MKLLDRHVFSEWLKIFLLSIGAILGLLVLERLFSTLKELLEYGATPAQALQYYLILLPSTLPEILPLSLLISILFSLGNLHRNNEITAMRATGLSLKRIALPLWITGGLFTVAVFWLQAETVPWSVEKSRTLWQNYAFSAELEEGRKAEEVGLIRNLSFYNHRDRRIWFINRFSEFNYRAFGVTVHRLGPGQKEVSRYVANEGFFDDIEGHWVFLEGREITFDRQTGEPIRSQPFRTRSLPAFSETPQLMKLREKRPKDLSLFELQELLGYLSGSEDPGIPEYRTRYHGILASPFVCLIVVGLATPFAVSGVRVNPMVGVSKALGLFFLYYLTASIFIMLGSQGVISSVIAAWLPNLIMLAFAGWLGLKVRTV